MNYTVPVFAVKERAERRTGWYKGQCQKMQAVVSHAYIHVFYVDTLSTPSE